MICLTASGASSGATAWPSAVIVALSPGASGGAGRFERGVAGVAGLGVGADLGQQRVDVAGVDLAVVAAAELALEAANSGGRLGGELAGRARHAGDAGAAQVVLKFLDVAPAHPGRERDPLAELRQAGRRVAEADAAAGLTGAGTAGGAAQGREGLRAGDAAGAEPGRDLEALNGARGGVPVLPVDGDREPCCAEQLLHAGDLRAVGAGAQDAGGHARQRGRARRDDTGGR